MRFKNSELNIIGNILYRLALKGKDSRMRTRFINQINKHADEILEPERMQLLKQYSELDKDDNIITIGEDSKEAKLREESVVEFYRELEILMNEYMYVDISEKNKDMLNSIAEILLNQDLKYYNAEDGEVEDLLLFGDDAMIYDNLCEEFENYLNTIIGGE